MRELLFACLLLLELTSCNNKQDFAYNEKITSDFYYCKERLDYVDKKVRDGGFDLDTAAAISYDMGLKEARRLAINCREIKATASLLQHTEAADVFHDQVIRYMSEIAEAYTPLLVQYVEQQDSIARKATALKLSLKKEALSLMEDKCLEAQIEFLNKAGIRINK